MPHKIILHNRSWLRALAFDNKNVLQQQNPQEKSYISKTCKKCIGELKESWMYFKGKSNTILTILFSSISPALRGWFTNWNSTKYCNVPIFAARYSLEVEYLHCQINVVFFRDVIDTAEFLFKNSSKPWSF
jgi:hypothetical protein